MRTRTRRQWNWPAAAAMAVALGAPSLAEAQQGGLFPLAPIRRQRVPCQMEDPVYRLYRQEYFGYHPTCWRRFPDGWGCPSPEAPNAAEAFRLLPRDNPDELEELNPSEGEGGQPGMGPGAAGPDRGAATPAPAGGTTPNPGTLPPLPSGERSPFDLDMPSTTPPAVNPPARTAPPAAAPSALPPAVAPSGTGVPVVPPAGASLGEPAVPETVPSDGADQPLLALPDPSFGPTSTVSSNAAPLPDLSVPGTGPLPPVADADTTPAQAPRRVGVLSRIFGGRTPVRR